MLSVVVSYGVRTFLEQLAPAVVKSSVYKVYYGKIRNQPIYKERRMANANRLSLDYDLRSFSFISCS